MSQISTKFFNIFIENNLYKWTYTVASNVVQGPTIHFPWGWEPHNVHLCASIITSLIPIENILSTTSLSSLSYEVIDAWYSSMKDTEWIAKTYISATFRVNHTLFQLDAPISVNTTQKCLKWILNNNLLRTVGLVLIIWKHIFLATCYYICWFVGPCYNIPWV